MAHDTRLLALTEEFFAGAKPSSVEADKGVIHGVKICGLLSANGRRYTKEALQKAIPLYEGCLVNIDHPSKPRDQRSAWDRFGKFEHVAWRDDGLYGDLVLLRTHPLATTVLEAAERMPEAYGLSHNVDVAGFTDADGVYVVKEIAVVRSVDLVADAATNKSLYESRMPMKKVKLKAFIEACKVLPIAAKAAILEMYADPNQQKMMDQEVPEVPDAGGDWKQDLANAIAKLVGSTDAADHDMAKKILAMLKPAEAAPAKKEEKEDDKEKEKKAEEARKAAATPGSTAITESKAKLLCKLAGVAEDKTLVATLTKLPEEQALEHLTFLQGLSATKPKTGPKSSSPGSITEGKAEAATDGKSFAKAITRR